MEVRLNREQDRSLAVAKLKPMGERVEALADRVLLYTQNGDAIANAVSGNGFGDASVLVRRASLEDVFLILTGRSLEED